MHGPRRVVGREGNSQPRMRFPTEANILRAEVEVLRKLLKRYAEPLRSNAEALKSTPKAFRRLSKPFRNYCGMREAFRTNSDTESAQFCAKTAKRRFCLFADNDSLA